MTKFSNHKARRGFTLIELLIVIGLLGALTALVLPAMMADREDALGNVCDYNQAGTVRVLKQFQQITGKLPNGMHSGLQKDATPMEGIPSAQSDHFALSDTIQTLTADEAKALRDAGVTMIAQDIDLNYLDVQEGTPVVVCTHDWKTDEGDDFSFDGLEIAELEARGMSKCVVFWIAPTTAWDAPSEANKDWGGGKVSVGMDLVGKCPVPAEGLTGEPEFSYYMAYVGIFEAGTTLSIDGILGDVRHEDIDEAMDEAASDAAGKGYVVAQSESADVVTDADSMNFSKVSTDPYGNSVYRATVYARTDDGSGGYIYADHVYQATDSKTSTTKLLGTSCPECGVMNP
ncbi:MAG: prepilin-type N-terminal cleavage/methylation domain-containing protein [Patescibacteria group bacterium]|nr:prepilin-type N-terminal cleavage/methylation domain-containing protein [Patescibacteria group bacterium]